MQNLLQDIPVKPIERDSWLHLPRIVQALELVQDPIVICLCIGLFSFMVLQKGIDPEQEVSRRYKKNLAQSEPSTLNSRN
jgi:uncharacterized membrane protein (DUF373 family)